ncbi:TPR repeat-containing protein [Caballeronia calidae]|uniref:TPR repeat-containing protein n=1 Tax=Caballeronia calidae TaxID=1777139 RepID=A0A158BG42_9BURK|nr:TPR repeat-containing protein [Caballeronia calidae]
MPSAGTGRSRATPPDLSIPQWKGAPARADRDRLLILNEQGFGDSLQKPVDDAKHLQPQQRALVVDWMDEIADFADTAALVAALDLVICVDTSVAHLAGAMGRRVWLLNRHLGCWRRLRDREDTPWYPNMRIFNQKAPGDWDEVLGRVLAELEWGAWRS